MPCEKSEEAIVLTTAETTKLGKREGSLLQPNLVTEVSDGACLKGQQHPRKNHDNSRTGYA
jgi:hypothetical protein